MNQKHLGLSRGLFLASSLPSLSSVYLCKVGIMIVCYCWEQPSISFFHICVWSGFSEQTSLENFIKRMITSKHSLKAGDGILFQILRDIFPLRPFAVPALVGWEFSLPSQEKIYLHSCLKASLSLPLSHSIQGKEGQICQLSHTT